MPYVELYSKDILDVASLGQIASDFNESNGDYIKVEVFNEDSDTVLNTFFSNRLLLMYPEVDDYYIGPYHYHPESPSMGFCTEKEHTNNSVTNLRLIPVGNDNVGEPFTPGIEYKNQFDIFRDDGGKIYIKPNEIFKLIKLGQATYKLRIYFLRNIKSTLGSFLALNKNNLIENGNFFAGLEATQTGDIDSSTGRNNFVMMNNPGFSPYALEQDGIGNNIYNMKVTGIDPSSYYVFSCWVAWNNGFNGIKNIVYFNNAGNDVLSTLGQTSSTIQEDAVETDTLIGAPTQYQVGGNVPTQGEINMYDLNGDGILDQTDIDYARSIGVESIAVAIENILAGQDANLDMTAAMKEIPKPQPPRIKARPRASYPTGDDALLIQDNTDLAGSWISYEEKDDIRILSTKVAGGITWLKLFAKVYTNQKANLGSININLGTTSQYASSNPAGRRYFTDLRFEQIENFDIGLLNYINELKSGKLK